MHYSRKGEPDTIIYNGTECGIVTIDMMNKGNMSPIFGVSGDLNA